MEKLYTVSELAQNLGTTPRAVRFYEDKGLIRPQRAGNTRVYTHRDRGRLILILRGKRLGFSLREIRDWLDLYDSDPGQVEQARVLLDKVGARIDALEGQLADVKATLKELRRIEAQAKDHLAALGRADHDASGARRTASRER